MAGALRTDERTYHLNASGNFPTPCPYLTDESQCSVLYRLYGILLVSCAGEPTRPRSGGPAAFQLETEGRCLQCSFRFNIPSRHRDFAAAGAARASRRAH
eukprot:4040763-Pleurochrysis_carterae.AAC.1